MTEISIFIKDTILSELITLELGRLGYTFGDKKEGSLIFITDSENEASPIGAKKILISNTASQNCSDHILRRPVDLALLRSCVASALESRTVATVDPKNNKISIKKKEKCANVGGKKVQLTENEFLLLSRLIESGGELVSREQINSLLGSSGNTPEVYICSLRKKLTSCDGFDPINTVRGKGYKLR